MNRREVLLGTVASIIPQAAFAWTHGSGIGNLRSNLNVDGAGDNREAKYINCCKSADRIIGTDAGTNPSWWQNLTDNQYPTSATNGITSLVYVPGNTSFVVKWLGSGSVTSVSFGAFSNNSRTVANYRGMGSTTWGGGGAGGATVTNGRMTFTSGSGQSSLITVKGTTINNLVICRADEEDAYDGGQNFRSAFLAQLTDFRPRSIRFLGPQIINTNFLCQWADRMTLDTITYGSTCFFSGHKAPSLATGTNTYAVAAYPSMPVSLTHGEFVHLSFTNSSTVASPTIDVGGRGAKTILTQSGTVLVTSGTDSSSRILSASFYTLIYDAFYDSWFMQPFGLPNGEPLESLVELCNATNLSGWFHIPLYASDDYITQFANYLAANYRQNEVFIEYANEIWNIAAGFPLTTRAAVWGSATFSGIGSGNGANYSGWYGYRMRQIAAIMRPLLGSKLNMVLASQGSAGDVVSTLTNTVENVRFKNASFPALTGANAPILFADTVSYALYYSGDQIRYTDAQWATSNNLASVQTAVDQYTSGIPASIQAAYNFGLADFQVRMATVATNTTRFGNWNTLAAAYNKPICLYEFNHEFDGPSVAFCVSTAPFNNIASFIQSTVNITTLAATNVSQRVPLPVGVSAGDIIIVFNGSNGSTNAFAKLGTSSVVATLSDTQITGGSGTTRGWTAFQVGATDTNIAVIMASGTSTINVQVANANILAGDTGTGYWPQPLAGTTSRVDALPKGTTVVVFNGGTTAAFVKLGTTNAVTATTLDTAVAANGGWTSLTIGANAYIASITGSGTAQLYIVGGTGSPASTGTNTYGGQSGDISAYCRAFMGSNQYKELVREYLAAFYSFSKSRACSIFAMCAPAPWLVFARLFPVTETIGGDSTQTPYRNWDAHKDYNNGIYS